MKGATPSQDMMADVYGSLRVVIEREWRVVEMDGVEAFETSLFRYAAKLQHSEQPGHRDCGSLRQGKITGAR